MINLGRLLLSVLTLTLIFTNMLSSPAIAQGKYEIFPRDPKGQPVQKSCGGVCNCTCQTPIEDNHRLDVQGDKKGIRPHMTDEFIKHRDWMIDEFFTKHILPAMMLMTSQLSTIAVQQVQMIGAFFDAKHQLETQQLFQQLMAEAHKDYQPSEGLCEIGTNIRSLAASSRKSDLSHVAFANRVMDRQLRNEDTVSGSGEDSDINGRLKDFKENYCNASDNSDGLSLLCASSTGGSANNNGSSGNNSNNGGGSNNSNGNGNGNSGNDSDGGNGCNTIFSVRDNDPEGGNGRNLKKFDIIEDNTGKDYVNSTGNYTVPCDGEYNFSGSAVTLDPDTAELSIQKDGLNIAVTSRTTANRQTMSVDITVDLKEGDVISLFTQQPLAIASHTFRGRLIKESGDDDGGSDGGGDDDGGSDSGSGGAVEKERANKDVDFSKTLGSVLTLDMDLTDEEVTADEENVFSLTANLFAHSVLPAVPREVLATKEGKPRAEAHRYMDLRSISAKRSVAQNSIAAMVSERTKGDKEVAPFLKKLVTELGVKETEVEDILGKEPSYYAQMEVLTKNIYQNPVFFTELYDKPANVLRKSATIRALTLMQERDLYESQLRSEAVLAVILETMLMEEHNRVNALLSNLEPKGGK